MDVLEKSDGDDPEGLDKAFLGSAKWSSNRISGLDMDEAENTISTGTRLTHCKGWLDRCLLRKQLGRRRM